MKKFIEIKYKEKEQCTLIKSGWLVVILTLTASFETLKTSQLNIEDRKCSARSERQGNKPLYLTQKKVRTGMVRKCRNDREAQEWRGSVEMIGKLRNGEEVSK